MNPLPFHPAIAQTLDPSRIEIAYIREGGWSERYLQREFPQYHSRPDVSNRPEQGLSYAEVARMEVGAHSMQHLVDYVVASSHDDRPSATAVKKLSFGLVQFLEDGLNVLLHAIEHNAMPSLTTYCISGNPGAAT
jgi:hypothetical protein